jgi:hypothetical protein
MSGSHVLYDSSQMDAIFLECTVNIDDRNHYGVSECTSLRFYANPQCTLNYQEIPMIKTRCNGGTLNYNEIGREIQSDRT